jgi:hypothetical protein
MRGSITITARLIAVTLFLLVVAHVCAAAEENQPAIIIDEIVHDFGTVFQQESYKHTFVVKNEGKADLIIKEVKPG